MVNQLIHTRCAKFEVTITGELVGLGPRSTVKGLTRSGWFVAQT